MVFSWDRGAWVAINGTAERKLCPGNKMTGKVSRRVRCVAVPGLAPDGTDVRAG